jgi:Mrp family chromosome partitioning ATPase
MSARLGTSQAEPADGVAPAPARSASRSTTTSRVVNGQSDVVKTIDELPTSAVDSVRELLATLQRQSGERSLPVKLGFTSPLAGEGVSFIARTVAAVIAHDLRQRVCLIDLNWATPVGAPGRDSRRRRASAKDRSGADATALPGLAEALRRELSRRDALLDSDDPRRDTRRQVTMRDLVFETNDPRLSYVAAGPASVAESQVFAHSEQLSQIITSLARHYDHVVLDLPAVLASSLTIPLVRQADAVGLVVRHGVTTEAQVRAALERLANIPLAGVVLNRTSSKIPRLLRRRMTTW